MAFTQFWLRQLGLFVTISLCTLQYSHAADAIPVYKNTKATLEARVDDLYGRLTQEEKIRLMAGGGTFTMAAIPRLGIPGLELSDGPNGLRSNYDQAATVFPTGVSLASTWNPDLMKSIGEVMGQEARAMKAAVVLGPNVNIQRTPLAGRNFETYSEDPFLAGRLGVGLVTGIQSQGVGTSVKHYVGNEQELERNRSSSNIDERTLREIYLAPFEAIVRDAKPWTVMVSYNRLNGTYMSENKRLINDVLKREWAYDGVVMSDWGAVHSTVEAANAGLDLEMPGPPKFFGDQLLQATRTWQVEQSTIDAAARRLIRLAIRTGALDTNAQSASADELASERNHQIAIAAAQEAITLLKNDRALLPLNKARIKKLAVIGPNADVAVVEGGGSSAVIPARVTTPLESLRAFADTGMKVTFAQGVDNDVVPPPADPRWLSPANDRKTQGLSFAFYDNAKFEGAPAKSGVDNYFDFANIAGNLSHMSARWEGYFWPPRDGSYELALSQIGSTTLWLDDVPIITPNTATQPNSNEGDILSMPLRTVTMNLKAGRGYRIKMEYVSFPVRWHAFRFGIRSPAVDIEEAIRVAKEADVAIVFVGGSRTTDSEGADRKDMELYGRQNELVKAVLAVNPNSIVVLNNGAPLTMPWIDQAPAVIEAWLPGEGGAEALTQILFGAVNPSGKLPITLPRRIEDNPTFTSYAGGRDANYGEGVFVGYRYYDKKKIAPLFPFGHGLSYTTFEYSNLRAADSVAVGKPIEVSIDVKNTGQRAGQETVQLYVGDAATKAVLRPIKELKGFVKANLRPGETRTLKFTLVPRDLSYYDVSAKDWVATPGEYHLYVGSSSQDIRQERKIHYIVKAPN